MGDLARYNQGLVICPHFPCELYVHLQLCVCLWENTGTKTKAPEEENLSSESWSTGLPHFWGTMLWVETRTAGFVITEWERLRERVQFLLLHNASKEVEHNCFPEEFVNFVQTCTYLHCTVCSQALLFGLLLSKGLQQIKNIATEHVWNMYTSTQLPLICNKVIS